MKLIKLVVGDYNYYLKPEGILGFYVTEGETNDGSIYSVLWIKTIYGEYSFWIFDTRESVENKILSVLGGDLEVIKDELSMKEVK